MTQKPDLARAARLSVAPMMDWTDRHCRMLHRVLSREALLYTEMVTSAAITHGDAAALLSFDPSEAPVALQLGGSDPEELARAVTIARGFGYAEFNLNVGCPSDRVQSGAFGAVLMKDPGLVAECLAAMTGAAGGTEVTVKCRIGVDDQAPEVVLPNFIAKVLAVGITRIAIHARKAWLEGLSPRENREIPPLDYGVARRMKDAFPDLHISLNGGVGSLDEARAHLEAGFDGVMVGRAAYHQPWDILGRADAAIWGGAPGPSPEEAVNAMLPYVEVHLAAGGRLHDITRHMLGLFHGRPGARGWRRYLSENAFRPGAGTEVLADALDRVVPQAA